MKYRVYGAQSTVAELRLVMLLCYACYSQLSSQFEHPFESCDGTFCTQYVTSNLEPSCIPLECSEELVWLQAHNSHLGLHGMAATNLATAFAVLLCLNISTCAALVRSLWLEDVLVVSFDFRSCAEWFRDKRRLSPDS